MRQASVLAEWRSFVSGLLDLHEAWYALLALGTETHKKNFLGWRGQHPRAADPARGVEGGRGVGLELTEGIPGVYWGNYMGPFYVEWFGREKLESLPCVEKRWLGTGGLFFTTARTPFEWDTPEAAQVQQAAKNHLGADAFFDIDAVRRALAELEPLPEPLEPEQLQPPRRVPAFPFKIEAPSRKPLAEQIEEARRHFEGEGFTYVGFEKGVLTFRDQSGGLTRVTVGGAGRVEYWPGT